MTILEQDLELWGALIENKEFQARNAMDDKGSRLIIELHLTHEVRNAMLRLKAFQD